MFNKTNQGENQKESYMQQLDGWIDEQVIKPLWEAWEMWETVGDEDEESVEREVAQAKSVVHKAIREKVLESYRNGQKATGARPPRPSFRRK